jgi:hypothetical protein
MRYLKQNTDSYVSIGMVLDKTAGLGNEDGLTVTSFSGVIVKEVQSSACTHTDFTPSATAANDWGMAAIGHGGLYQLKIPDSEINFVGSAMLAVWYDAEALPVWHEFMIVPANVWDSLMGTDLLDVSTVQWTGTAVHTATINGVPVVQLHGTGGLGVDAPTNFEDMSIVDTSGLVDITQTAADKVWGTTARTVTANTNIGGIEVDVTKIHGSSLTETSAGYLAAGFVKQYDVVTPVFTSASVNQGADNNVILANASKGLAKVYDDMAKDSTVSKPGTAQTITAPADMALNSSVAKEATLALTEDILRNKMEVVDATGAVTLYADNSSTPLLTGTVADDSTTTTRTRLA